jgi:hypothetical protein
MTSKQLRTLALAAAFLGSTTLAFAQSGAETGATNQGRTGSTTTGSATSTPPAMEKNDTSNTDAARAKTQQQSRNSGQVGDCPPGEARSAAPDGSKGPCRRM